MIIHKQGIFSILERKLVLIRHCGHFSRLPLRLAICTLLLFQTGCITSDTNIAKQTENRRGSNELSGTFVNKAIYVTKSLGFVGTSDFDYALGTVVDADTIQLNSSKGKSLYVALEKNGKKVFEKTYHTNEGLIFNGNGMVTLPKRTDFGSHDSPGIGYTSIEFKLFINRKGNLMVIQSGGGGGLAGVIPMFVYGNLMSIFPRKTHS